MNIKRFISIAIWLALTSWMSFGATYNVLLSYGAYTYTSGTAAYVEPSATEIVLTYSYLTGGYAGVGFPLNNIWGQQNISGNSRMVLTVKSGSSAMNVFLKNGSIKSTPYHLSGIPSNVFATFILDMRNFKNINLTIVDMIEIEPCSAGTNNVVDLINIALDTNIPSPSVSPLLISALVSGGLMTDSYPKLTTTADYREQLTNAWAGYKNMFRDQYQSIVSASVFGLIFDPYTGNSPSQLEATDYSTSEAAGYGLLFAVFCNDQSSFDALLDKAWSKLYKSGSTGLFSWIISSNGTVRDTNSAADADQDIAAALIFADILKQRSVWADTARSYSSKAQGLIDAIYKQDSEFNRYLRLGDYNYGGRTLTNPSYFAPAWYRLFDLYENQDHDWQPLIDQGYQTIASTNGYSRGLVPDWCDVTGQSVAATYSWDKYELGKEAIRVYWRLATDYLWFGESRAQTFLDLTKINFSGFVGSSGSVAPSAITFLNMSGVSVGGSTDVSLVAMYAAGAMGSTDTGYRSSWKGAYDAYQGYTYSGPYSFFTINSDGGEQYNYYNQSMAMLSGLILSGAFPNLLSLLQPAAPSLVSSVVPASLYTRSPMQIGLVLSSTSGGSFITTVDIQLAHPQGTIQLGVNTSKPTSPLVYQDALSRVRSLAVHKIITQNQLMITFDVVFNEGWNTGAVPVSWRAGDYKGAQTGWTLIQSATAYNYPQEYLSASWVTLNFPSISSLNGTNKFVTASLTQFVGMAMDRSAWQLQAFTDTVPGTTGQAGLGLYSTTGNLITVLPIKIMVTSNTYTITTWNDTKLVTVNDRDDATQTVIINGAGTLSPVTQNIYLAVQTLIPRIGDYAGNVFLKLLPTPNFYLDKFDKGDLETEWNTSWYLTALYTTLTSTPTTVSFVIVTGSYNNSSALKWSYVLGSANQAGNKPQASVGFNCRTDGAPISLAAYKGIAFWVKVSASVPLGVAIPSALYNPDYDSYIRAIHPPVGVWVRYQLSWDSFQQQGFGVAQPINTVLTSINSIQFKTISEKPGEAADVYMDEVELF